jgi:multidrug efflux pump subunit AcrA (membrane-fusion protein)
VVEDVVVAVTDVMRRRALAALALSAAAACESAPAAERAPQAAPVSAPMVVDTATVELPRAYPAQVYVEHDVAVAARAPGVLDSLFVQLGSRVRAGAPLALVDARAQELARSGGVTRTEAEQAAGEFRQAELNVQQAEHALLLTRVDAPFAGVVTARYARPRQLVADGDTLFRIAETSPQLVRIRVAEPAARGVRSGDHATVRATSGPTSVTAAVVFTAPALEPASGTREVILQLAAAPFLVGEAVAVEMGSERRVAIVAPREAIAPDGYALVAQGGRTTMRPVTVGATLPGGRVEIVSGLAAGERLAPLRR